MTVENIIALVTLLIFWVPLCIFWISKEIIFDYMDLYGLRKKYEYDYANFDTFLRVYKKYDESITGTLRYHLWNEHVQLHESKIIFDEHLMVLYPLSYLKYRTWLKEQKDDKTSKPESKRKKGLFN